LLTKRSRRMMSCKGVSAVYAPEHQYFKDGIMG
jgi:hypothetical protein